MFSNKEWVNPPFCEDEIAKDPSLQVTRLGPQGPAASTGRACLARSRVVSRARVRLGDTRARAMRRAGAPSRRTARTLRWCVRGGGSLSAVVSRGRVVLVASSVRGARAGRLRVGAKARGRSGLRRRGRVVYRVRGGRVVLVGLARTSRSARLYGRRV